MRRLATPPYWLVLVTEQNPIDLDMLAAVLLMMGQVGQSPFAAPPRVSRTRVRVNPDEAARKGNVTRYSRTADALPLHTDCSNKKVPDNMVAFAMERPDSGGGGESVMLVGGGSDSGIAFGLGKSATSTCISVFSRAMFIPFLKRRNRSSSSLLPQPN